MSAQNVETVSTQQGSLLFGFNINLRHVSLLLVVFGLLVSGYLSYVKATDVQMLCMENSGFNCGVVQNSSYSEINFPILGEVAIAYLGFITYIVIGLLVLFQNRIAFLQENGMMLTFVVVLFAFVYSMYLVYVQGVILQAWCQWCLMHEVNMTALIAVTLLRMRNYFATE